MQLILRDKKNNVKELLEKMTWDAEIYIKENKDLRLMMESWNEEF
jgi:hypothetical protein